MLLFQTNPRGVEACRPTRRAWRRGHVSDEPSWG